MSDIHVAVGVIRNNKNQVLIARRPNHVHLGGLWEFPGGKVEADETVQQALQRELKEELNISFDISQSKPLIKIKHQYPEKTVLLDVWIVDEIKNHPCGNENQPIQWVSINQLNQFDFPEANKAIVMALTLPNKYLITGDFSSENEFKRRLQSAFINDIHLVQLRAKQLSVSDFYSVAKKAVEICHTNSVKIILNAEPELLNTIHADGIHLSVSRLFGYQSRPIGSDKYLFASCHNEKEIQQAIKISADAIVLGPVKTTSSHSCASALGWSRFSDLVEKAPMPVFALGGLRDHDLQMSKTCGAQGIAAISAWW